MAFSKARRLANLMSSASDTVPASKVNTVLADDAVTTQKIADDAITTPLIADDQITTALIADDAVTADQLANSINSAITANTAKVTNAITTHTGDVTGGAALTIAVDAVDIPMLSASGSPSSTTFLRGDNAWASVPAGVDIQSSVPSVASEGSLYYNTTLDVLYVSNGSAWLPLLNIGPTTTGGTVTISPQNGGSTFSYNLGLNFTDDTDTDTQLSYTLVSGSLPTGCVLPSAGNSAFTGTAANTGATYNFVIRATDTKNASADQSYTQVISSVTVATGGTITTSGGYKYHTFTGSGTFAITSAGTVFDALIVAGGGSGGGSLAGGGGAGGAIEANGNSAAVANHSIVIGAGAAHTAGGTYNAGYNGANTTAFSNTATGGGRGAGGVHVSPYTYNNAAGGSGGGGFGWDFQKNDHTGGAGTSGQGNAGGNASSSTYYGAGGGGKGAAGTDADGTGGDGGVGINWKSLGTYYAGGGGGSASAGTNKGAGGNGGGGAGTAGGVSSNVAGTAGTVNTGGGGGGGFGYGINGGGGGGAGGSGIVIIRYAV